MRKKGKTITWKERQKIEQLVKIDLPISQIAEEIGVTRAAIYVELKRVERLIVPMRHRRM